MTDSYFFNPAVSTAFTTTSTSLVAVSGLTQAVAPGAVYRVHAFGRWQMSTQTTTTARLLLGASGVVASLIAARTMMQSAVAGAMTQFGNSSFTPASPTLLAPGVIATAYAWEISGLVRVSTTGGNLQIMALCGGTAGGTLTVETGSVMMMEQVA